MAASGHSEMQKIAELDLRMGRIEEALERIVEYLGLRKLEILPPLSPPPPTPSLPPHTDCPVRPESAFRPTEPERIVEAAKTGPYVYKPLDATKDEIRILVLGGKTKRDAPVKAQLQHISLSNKAKTNQFKALSYTWGDATMTVDITLDGHQFPVTKNLYVALKSIRNLESSHWWVDAICINQEDVLERNSQVAMMTMIFKRSLSVRIWLGDVSEDSDLGMELIEKLSAVKVAGPGDKKTLYPDCSMTEKVRNWQALTRLLQRPWWERVWVRQEVAVGKRARVQCGRKICQFEQICDVAGILHSLVEQHGCQPIQPGGYSIDQSASTSGKLRISCYLRATMLQELRDDFRRHWKIKYGELTRLLFHTRSCKSTDPRDKVFAVLGLADPALYNVKLDYRFTVDQALKTVARAIITKKQSLDILAGCQNPEKENDLPSWVPNLTEDWKAHPFKVNISGSVYVSDKVDFAFHPDNDSILQAKGRTISSVIAICDDRVTIDATTDQLDILYQNWKEFACGNIIPILKGSIPTFSRGKWRLDGEEDDRAWIELLSLGIERGYNLRYSEDGKLLSEKASVEDNSYHNAMVENLLLPKAEDERAFKTNPYKKFHENLRKYGIGRRLACIAVGYVGLVPGDTALGDEICTFSNTQYPFILRKVQTSTHIVIGEAYFSNQYLWETMPMEEFRKCSKATTFNIT